MDEQKNHHLSQSEVIEQVPAACADELAALDFFEKQRWGDTPGCIHCGSIAVYTIKDKKTGLRRLDGRWRCKDCHRQYTVRVDTVMEDSPIPMRKWAYAFWCAASAKNGVSALEMARKIQVTYKTALYLMNRIRWAMNEPEPPKLKGVVEADETYVGGKPRFRLKGKRGRRSDSSKTPVFAILERGGDVRAQVMSDVTAKNLRKAIEEAAEEEQSILMTDESPLYFQAGKPFKRHCTVNHSSGEYVNCYNKSIHTNTIEGFFSRVKRQLNGTYHAVSRQHLHRYLAHAAFLYNARNMNDGERIARLIKATEGKRLLYRLPKKAG